MKIIFDNVVIGSSHYLLSLVGLGNHDGLIFSLQNLFNNVRNLDECLVHESGGWVTYLQSYVLDLRVGRISYQEMFHDLSGKVSDI